MKIPDQWTFDSPDVADSFGDHVREQLPWYDLVTDAVAQIGRHYIPRNGLVYDIGASTGNIAQALYPITFEREARVVGIEPSEEMVARHKAPGGVEHARAEDYPFEPFDFAVSMLALMFVPPASVGPLLDRLAALIRPGGALVVVERTLPPAGYLGLVSSRLTLAAKSRAGASGDDIVAKELSIAGVQRPLDVATLRAHGAHEWFRFGDFAGYVIEGASA